MTETRGRCVIIARTCWVVLTLGVLAGCAANPTGQTRANPEKLPLPHEPSKSKSLTQNGDLRCPELVAPYSLTDNLQNLFNPTSWASLARIAVNGTSTRPDPEIVVKNAKDSISYDLRVNAYQMNWVPMELEVAYGEYRVKELEEQGSIQSSGTESGPGLYAAAQKLLDTTLAGVTEPHEYTFKVLVTTNSGQNALALPGGFVLVDPALLTDPKLARKAQFAMAHEIAHVLQRHQTRVFQARIIDTISLQRSLHDISNVMRDAKNSPKSVVAAFLAGKLQFEMFYVEQELHADGCAVRILNRTQPSVRELIAVLQDFISQLPKTENHGKREPTAGSVQDAVKNVKTKNAESLIDLVTRPIERHPNSNERVRILNETLSKLREEAGLPPKKRDPTPRKHPPAMVPHPARNL